MTTHSELPDEIWEVIFELATEDERIYATRFPHAMERTEWFPHVEGYWVPRGPSEVIKQLQRKGYATKKAILLTCRSFYTITCESMFRYIFLPTPRRLAAVVNILNAEPHLALRTRRMQLFSAPPDPASALLLRGILRQCKNLEILIIDGTLSRSVFVSIADALRKSVRAIQLHLTTDCMPSLIWMLSVLPQLECASFKFSRPAKKRTSLGTATSELDTPLGSMSHIDIDLPRLEQLEVRGPCTAFLEQAAEWRLPRLHLLVIDTDTEQTDLPDVIEFLTHHGTSLEHLDLNGLESMPIPEMLDLCPILRTLIFNPDWKLVAHDAENNPDATAVLVHEPHETITEIGLHGLEDALGVARQESMDGEEETKLPTATQMVITLRRRTNDSIFRALTKINFPNLECIRAVSRTLLAQLERANGPGQEPGCFERWEQWWNQSVSAGIRLEDCTGDYLGTLPNAGEDDEEEAGDEEGDESSGSEDVEGPSEPIRDELRELLAECQKMNATREAPSPFVALFQAMNMGAGAPGMMPPMTGLGFTGVAPGSPPFPMPGSPPFNYGSPQMPDIQGMFGMQPYPNMMNPGAFGFPRSPPPPSA